VRILVVDASALVEFLLRTSKAPSLDPVLTDAEADLHAPSLTDLEVVSVLRRLARQGSAPIPRLEQALSDYLDLPLTRHGHGALLHRCFALRDVLSSYDAAYVALAEGLEGTLVTADRRLARAAEGLDLPCLPA